MNTHTVTKDQITDGKYTGTTDLSNFDGHIEIKAGLGWVTFIGTLSASGYILAEAGSGIKAGDGIEAGDGIQSQLAIRCNLKLTCAKRIFAGLCYWRAPSEGEMQIVCGKLESGEIAFGTLVETGLPIKETDESKPNKLSDSERITILENNFAELLAAQEAK